MTDEFRAQGLFLTTKNIEDKFSVKPKEVFSVEIEDSMGFISRFIVKLGKSKFGYPELSIITKARKTGKKRVRSLQSIPVAPHLWEAKKKKREVA